MALARLRRAWHDTPRRRGRGTVVGRSLVGVLHVRDGGVAKQHAGVAKLIHHVQARVLDALTALPVRAFRVRGQVEVPSQPTHALCHRPYVSTPRHTSHKTQARHATRANQRRRRRRLDDDLGRHSVHAQPAVRAALLPNAILGWRTVLRDVSGRVPDMVWCQWSALHVVTSRCSGAELDADAGVASSLHRCDSATLGVALEAGKPAPHLAHTEM